jgi:hypothetical protein
MAPKKTKRDQKEKKAFNWESLYNHGMGIHRDFLRMIPKVDNHEALTTRIERARWYDDMEQRVAHYENVRSDLGSGPRKSAVYTPKCAEVSKVLHMDLEVFKECFAGEDKIERLIEIARSDDKNDRKEVKLLMQTLDSYASVREMTPAECLKHLDEASDRDPNEGRTILIPMKK